MKDEKQIGIIHEIGDMGLGFDPLSEEDKKIIEQTEKNKEDNDKE